MLVVRGDGAGGEGWWYCSLSDCRQLSCLLNE